MILAQKRLQSSGVDTLILSIPGNKTARRLILCNRGSVDATVTVFIVPVDQSGPPNPENEVLGAITVQANTSEFINQGEIEASDSEQIWAKGAGAGLDVVVTVMT